MGVISDHSFADGGRAFLVRERAKRSAYPTAALLKSAFWIVATTLSLTAAARAQTEAQAWALGAVAEAVIAAEKCPTAKYNPLAGSLLLGAARIQYDREPYKSMLARRIMGERFSWDTNPDPHACEKPMLTKMQLLLGR